MEDQTLIKLFWERDESAIQAGEEQYGKRLRAMAGSLLGDPRDAEECVSDTWLRAWNAIPPEWPEHLFAYLARICRNLALNRLDWQQAAKRQAEVVALTEELEACIPSSLRERDLDLDGILTTFLSGLSERQRLVFLRRYWFGDTIREIAVRYDLRESRVKMLLLRARNRLREMLEKEGIEV